MKAIIVEIKENKVAALCSDGRIIKLKNKQYIIGQEIDMKSSNNIIKFAASAAAALVVFAVPAWAYLTPYSYVSIDVNPSVEFSLNRFDKVLSIKAVNDDGEELLRNIDLNQLKNEDINDAVKEVVKEIKESGFFSEEESGLVVAASSKTEEKTEELKEKVKHSVEDEVYDEDDEDEDEDEENESNDNGKTDDEDLENDSDKEKDESESKNKVEIEAIGVGQERVDQAKDLGVTPGKLNLVEKLQASAPDKEYVTEEWLNKSVKDIQKEIKENKKIVKEEIKENKNDKKSNESTNETNETDETNKTNGNSKNNKNK